MKHCQMLESRLTIDTNDSILGGRSAHPLLSNFIAHNSGVGSTPSTPLSSNMSPHAAPFYPGEDTVESVIGYTFMYIVLPLLLSFLRSTKKICTCLIFHVY